MRHWRQQLAAATQYFTRHPPLSPRQLLSRFEKAEHTAEALESKSASAEREARACRENIAAAEALLGLKEDKYREAIGLVGRLDQLSTPASVLEHVKGFHATELGRAREELQKAEAAYHSANSVLAMIAEEKTNVDKKIADLKVEEEMTAQLALFYQAISPHIEQWSEAGRNDAD